MFCKNRAAEPFGKRRGAGARLTVHDDGCVDSIPNGVRRRLKLRHHPSRDRPILYERRYDACHIREQQQAVAYLESASNCSCGGVGVDVVGIALRIHADWCDDGDDALVAELGDERDVDPLRLAHQSEVHGNGPAGLRVNDGLLRLARAQNAAVLAAETHGYATGLLNRGHDALVDAPAEDHLRYLHRGRIRDPQALHVVRLDVQASQHVLDLGPAAVDNHHLDAHRLKEHHIRRELLRQARIHHRVATVLHHHVLAGITLNVRQRSRQHLARYGRRDDLRLRSRGSKGSLGPRKDSGSKQALAQATAEQQKKERPEIHGTEAQAAGPRARKGRAGDAIGSHWLQSRFALENA
eukprot:scaffold2473_cov247-Pinguiococcus_pyrenoidosus.AAC.18